MGLPAAGHKVTKISALFILIELIPFITGGDFSALVIRLAMIGLLFNIIVTLLLSLGYTWMKWVMLVFAILGLISLFNIVNEPEPVQDMTWLNVFIKLAATAAYSYIALLLFTYSRSAAQPAQSKVIS